jgi:hypothetical protein
MPAITVDDITALPRIPEPDPTVARQRAEVLWPVVDILGTNLLVDQALRPLS